MPYDIFISYSRRDNKGGRITELKQRIEADYREIAKEELQCFFDMEDIRGMDDWRHRILQGLRESLAIWQRSGNPEDSRSGKAHWVLGTVAVRRGDCVAAKQHLEEALRLLLVSVHSGHIADVESCITVTPIRKKATRRADRAADDFSRHAL